MSFTPFILPCLTVVWPRADAAVPSVEPCNYIFALYLYSKNPYLHLVSRTSCNKHTNILYVLYISAVKRLRYLIAMNRIDAIVNSRLIAINRTIWSLLNVPWFLFAPLFFSNCNGPIWIGLLFLNVFYLKQHWPIL